MRSSSVFTFKIIQKEAHRLVLMVAKGNVHWNVNIWASKYFFPIWFECLSSMMKFAIWPSQKHPHCRQSPLSHHCGAYMLLPSRWRVTSGSPQLYTPCMEWEPPSCYPVCGEATCSQCPTFLPTPGVSLSRETRDVKRAWQRGSSTGAREGESAHTFCIIFITDQPESMSEKG